MVYRHCVSVSEYVSVCVVLVHFLHHKIHASLAIYKCTTEQPKIPVVHHPVQQHTAWSLAVPCDSCTHLQTEQS